MTQLLLFYGDTMVDHPGEFRTETADDGSLVLVMPITLDSVSTPNIKREAIDTLAAAAEPARVDLTSTTFMDSAGIGLLVTLYRTAKERGQRLILVGAKDQPLSLIRTVQMDRVVDIKTG